MSFSRQLARRYLAVRRKAYRKAVGRCPQRRDRGPHAVTTKRCGDPSCERKQQHVVCRSCGLEFQAAREGAGA